MTKMFMKVLLEKGVIKTEIVEKKLHKAIKANILLESVDILKEFDEKIAKTFSIPKHVFLPEDYIQKVQYTAEDEKKLEETYNDLKKRYTHVSPSNSQLERKINKIFYFLGCVFTHTTNK